MTLGYRAENPRVSLDYWVRVRIGIRVGVWVGMTVNVRVRVTVLKQPFRVATIS